MVAGRVSLHYGMVPAQPWPALERAWLPLLPAPRRAAITRLRAALDRNASLLGIALLAAALRETGVQLEPGALLYAARRKPRLRHGPEFSIAHGGGWVGCALTDTGRIGFDLEARAAVRAGQLRLLLDAGERARLARGGLAPADAWVIKEAVAKAAGLGLAAVARVRLKARSAVLDGREYRLRRLALAASMSAWLAYDAPRLRVRLVAHAASDFGLLPPAPRVRRIRGR